MEQANIIFFELSNNHKVNELYEFLQSEESHNIADWCLLSQIGKWYDTKYIHIFKLMFNLLLRYPYGINAISVDRICLLDNEEAFNLCVEHKCIRVIDCLSHLCQIAEENPHCFKYMTRLIEIDKPNDLSYEYIGLFDEKKYNTAKFLLEHNVITEAINWSQILHPDDIVAMLNIGCKKLLGEEIKPYEEMRSQRQAKLATVIHNLNISSYDDNISGIINEYVEYVISNNQTYDEAE